MANQSDQISQLASILVRMHVDDGRAARARLKGRLEVGMLAKLCGTTPEAIRAWETGVLAPTTGQALTWLTALYGHATATGADVAKVTAATAARPPLGVSAVAPDGDDGL